MLIMTRLFEAIKKADYKVTVGVIDEFAGQVDGDYLKKLADAPRESLKTLVDDYLGRLS